MAAQSPVMKEKWIGQYVYGNGYPEDMIGRAVEFEIEWTNTDGNIKGTCIDEESKDVFDTPATIEGFIDDKVISFIKKYPGYWEIDESGRDIVDMNKPSSEIHYSGLWMNGQYEGDWEIATSYVLENGDILETFCAGTWVLNRI